MGERLRIMLALNFCNVTESLFFYRQSMQKIDQIDYDSIADLNYFSQTFKSRFIEFNYRLVLTQGFFYVVSYKYDGTQYKDNTLTIGDNGYPNLVMYFLQSSPPSVPHVLEKLKTELRNKLVLGNLKATRVNVLNIISPIDEAKIHLFCIVWIFHMFDKAVESYGRNIMDFCLQVKKDVEINGLDSSLQGLLLTKLVNLVSHSNFEYKITLPTFDYENW
jgi:hypothetical protein